MRRPSNGESLARVGVWTAGVLAVLAIVALMIFGSIAGCGAIKGWQRGQARANAQNAVRLTGIQVQNQTQYAKVITAHNATVSAQAQQRFLEAVGIRRAQDEISRTLTPLYVQHEAIQAQEQIASSGRNNTVVYVPSGTNGVPLVQQTPGANQAQRSLP